MVSAVIDTNILVAGILTANPRSASRRVIDGLFSGAYDLLLSPTILQEIQDVLTLPRLQSVHRLTADQIQRFCHSLQVRGRMFSGTREVSAALTRDVTDTKWVALALEADADYLVTRDRRHLHRLRTVGHTRIVTAHQFLQQLGHLE